jgi:hypothetical protein
MGCFQDQASLIQVIQGMTVHLAEPTRDLWLVFREEADGLPTLDFKS